VNLGSRRGIGDFWAVGVRNSSFQIADFGTFSGTSQWYYVGNRADYIKLVRKAQPGNKECLNRLSEPAREHLRIFVCVFCEILARIKVFLLTARPPVWYKYKC
jgi:hypothetical protein